MRYHEDAKVPSARGRTDPMRSVMVVLAVLGLAVGAWADPADLWDGVLIAHHVPEYVFVSDPCTEYASHAIHDLSQVVNQLSGGMDVWWVLAAWNSGTKIWCGTEFGFGPFDPEPFAFHASGACFPVGGLEIPTPSWPGPNEGTAFVTTGDPWNGNYVPVYWFRGYAYGYPHGATVIPLDVDPSNGFCGFCNCTIPPTEFYVGPDQRGAMGVNLPGITPTFPSPPQPWACCFSSMPYCRMLIESICLQVGGVWMGEGVSCCPIDPCPHPGACCLIGVCSLMFEEECTLVGGTFMGPDTFCEPNPCEAVCCFDFSTAPHACEVMLEDDCLAAQGFWHPEVGSCDPNPCEIYTPTHNSSWGRIKSMYR